MDYEKLDGCALIQFKFTLTSMLPKSKLLLNKSSTVGLWTVSNLLKRNLFKMEVFLRNLAEFQIACRGGLARDEDRYREEEERA